MSSQRNIGNVLIIDDDPILQEVVRAYVLANGANQVFTATDGNEAVDLLKEPGRRFGLIVCDINMPGKDGIETISYLEKIDCPSPLIIISSAGDHLVEAARKLASAFSLNLIATLHKPVDFNLLGNALAATFSETECAA